MAITIDGILDDTDSSSFADSGKPYIVECAYQLAAEVRRLRDYNEILRAKVDDLQKLENIDKLLSRRAILDALDNFRAALEAVKE